MASVLKLAHLAKKNRVPQMQIGGGWVHAKLDTPRTIRRQRVKADVLGMTKQVHDSGSQGTAAQPTQECDGRVQSQKIHAQRLQFIPQRAFAVPFCAIHIFVRRFGDRLGKRNGDGRGHVFERGAVFHERGPGNGRAAHGFQPCDGLMDMEGYAAIQEHERLVVASPGLGQTIGFGVLNQKIRDGVRALDTVEQRFEVGMQQNVGPQGRSRGGNRLNH